MDVLFEDGSRVRCTRDHPFLTPTGWVAAADMTGYRCYNGVTQRIQWRAAWIRRLSVRRVKSFAAFVTTDVAACTSGAMADRFIATCGHSTTIGPASQRGSRSTTLTWTPRTTGAAISSYCSKDEHMDLHQRLGHSRGIPPQAAVAAVGWHGSDAGRAWHAEHYAKVGEAIHRTAEFACEHCGKLFVAEVTGRNRFCSNACKSYARKASGVDNEERACVVCGVRFVANRYVAKRTCSRACSGALSGSVRRGRG